jgi:hypothetical protein
MDQHADHVAAGVRAELERVRAVEEQVLADRRHHADPGSDLAVDEARFPDIWATSVARRSLTHSIENIDAAGALALSEQWIAPPFVLLRASYESAGALVWLLAPDDADTRLARLLWQHHDSWRYSATAYAGTPLDDLGEHEQRREWAEDAAQKLGVDLRRTAPGGFQKLIASIDDQTGQPGSLLTAWRVCSGVSHAKTWSLNTITTEVDSKPVYEHGHLSARVVNTELFLNFLRVARRTVERAWGLYCSRTTTRPHTPT